MSPAAFRGGSCILLTASFGRARASVDEEEEDFLRGIIDASVDAIIDRGPGSLRGLG
jgi:hypothetical protein